MPYSIFQMYLIERLERGREKGRKKGGEVKRKGRLGTQEASKRARAACSSAG